MSRLGKGIKRRAPWFIAIAASFLLAASLYLLLPPSPDQFDHGYSAWRLLSGDVPYRDVMDVNWPGVIGLHALSLSLFGVHLWSWRAFDFLLLIPAAWCMADLVRQSAGDLGGRITLLVTPLLYVSAGYWVAGQKDMTGGLFLVVALWLHVRGYRRGGLVLHAAAGLCIGVAVLNKPTLGLVLPMLPLHALAHGYRWPRAAAATFANVVGLGIALALAFAWIHSLGTSWRDFADMVFTYPRSVRSFNAAALTHVVDKLVHLRMSGFLTLLIAGCLPVWVMLYRRRALSLSVTALALLWLTGLLSAIVQTHGYGYHLSPTFLAAIGTLSIALALLVGTEASPGRPAWRHAAAMAAVLVVVGGVAYRIELSYGGLLDAVHAGNLEPHRERFQGESGSALSLADALRFVRRLEAEPDRGCVFFVGEGSAINLLSQRRYPTRFYYLPTIKRAEPPLPMAARWSELWAADLARADCRYVLVSYARHAAWIEGPSEAAAALRALLARYEQVEPLGRDHAVRVYRLRGN